MLVVERIWWCPEVWMDTFDTFDPLDKVRAAG